MRAILPDKLELGRVKGKNLFRSSNEGRNGSFLVQGPCGCELHINSWDGHGEQSGWEQVAVDTDRNRSPNWLEMCHVKDLFWDEEERVMQLHPPLSEYVKNSRTCLHLWKPKHEIIPAPPSRLAGIVGFGPDESKLWIDQLMRCQSDEQLSEVFAQPIGRAIQELKNGLA